MTIFKSVDRGPTSKSLRPTVCDGRARGGRGSRHGRPLLPSGDEIRDDGPVRGCWAGKCASSLMPSNSEQEKGRPTNGRPPMRRRVSGEGAEVNQLCELGEPRVHVLACTNTLPPRAGLLMPLVACAQGRYTMERVGAIVCRHDQPDSEATARQGVRPNGMDDHATA